MNRLTRNLYLLAVPLVLAGCFDRETRSSNAARATIARNWPAAGIARVKVAEVDGSITVEASATNEISLLATAKGDLDVRKGEENDGLFVTRLEGDLLKIGREERKRHGWNFDFVWGDDDVEIDYVLKVPPTVSLVVSTVNGKINTRGMEGETKAVTVNGTIDVEVSGQNELQATSVNGRVRAKFTRAFNGARFNSVNGGVQATLPDDASFAVNLSQVNGDFEASFPLSIHSNPGSRRVSGEVNGGQHPLKITTVNGDVSLVRFTDTTR